MTHLRDNLIISGGPSSFNKSNNQAFAQALDKLLAVKVRS
jgi:uncharacterized protein YaiI (UPF0178 family)